MRPLAKSDDRSGLSCGEPAIGRFFQHYAAQNQFRLHLVVTYVALVVGCDRRVRDGDGRICGAGLGPLGTVEAAEGGG